MACFEIADEDETQLVCAPWCIGHANEAQLLRSLIGAVFDRRWSKRLVGDVLIGGS